MMMVYFIIYCTLASSGLEAWYDRLASLKSWSASVLSASVPALLGWDSYTGVTLWHKAMAFTASWIRLLTLLRTLGPEDGGLRDGVELALLPFEVTVEVTWNFSKSKKLKFILSLSSASRRNWTATWARSVVYLGVGYKSRITSILFLVFVTIMNKNQSEKI